MSPIFRTITGLQIVQGERIPWWMGRAHYWLNEDAVLFAPIPLNIVISVCVNCWRGLRSWRGKFDNDLLEARRKGYMQGYARGQFQRDEILQKTIAKLEEKP